MAAWNALCKSLRVVRLKNKYNAAVKVLSETPSGAVTSHLREGEKTVFPNLHANILFKAKGCAPIVVEVQVNKKDIYEISHGDHKLYEVIRAETISDFSKTAPCSISYFEE